MCALRQLAGHVSGNATTLFALAMVPVICVAGAAVDYAEVTRARVALSDALDASLDVVGRAPAADPRQEMAVLRAGMARRLGPRFAAAWRIDSIAEERGRLVAVVSADVPTSVARLIGIREVPIRLAASADRAFGARQAD